MSLGRTISLRSGTPIARQHQNRSRDAEAYKPVHLIRRHLLKPAYQMLDGRNGLAYYLLCRRLLICRARSRLYLIGATFQQIRATKAHNQMIVDLGPAATLMYEYY